MKDKTMKDLTIIFLTINKVPKKWAKYQLGVLKEAIGDADVISVSKEPMDFGLNIIQDEEPSTANIYWQMLRAAKLAKTPYIAIAEDDVLYCFEHFNYFRPPLDTFAYNAIRWQLHTTDKDPLLYHRQRISNYSLIAPTKLLIETLEERFAKYPYPDPRGGAGEVGKLRTERKLRVTNRKMVEYTTTIGIVSLNHKFAIDDMEARGKKRMGKVRAVEIPFWGRVTDIAKKFI